MLIHAAAGDQDDEHGELQSLLLVIICGGARRCLRRRSAGGARRPRILPRLHGTRAVLRTLPLPHVLLSSVQRMREEQQPTVSSNRSWITRKRMLGSIDRLLVSVFLFNLYTVASWYV